MPGKKQINLNINQLFKYQSVRVGMIILILGSVFGIILFLTSGFHIQTPGGYKFDKDPILKEGKRK